MADGKQDVLRFPEFEGFREEAGKGRLAYKECRSCGKAHYYPRPLCPFCFSADTAWRHAAGTGTVYSFSVTSGAAGGTHIVAFVTLDEGFSVLTNLVECDADAVRIGQRVEAVFRETQGDGVMPVFRPVSEGE